MNDNLWHKCELPIFPRRDVNGGWTIPGRGQVWRRKINGRWQYKQDEETVEAWEDRQW